MKILAFAGSNSSQSINKKLALHALSHFPGDEHEVIDLNDFESKIYSMDREKNEGHPEGAHRFLKHLADCDLILLSMAEHNGNYTAAFKNLFDWSSRINKKIFHDKPMFLMSASPGPGGGVHVMNASKGLFPRFGAQILETFSLPSFNQNFEEGKGILHEELRAEFEGKLKSVQEKVGK
jgi:chromate reductase